MSRYDLFQPKLSRLPVCVEHAEALDPSRWSFPVAEEAGRAPRRLPQRERVPGRARGRRARRRGDRQGAAARRRAACADRRVAPRRRAGRGVPGTAPGSVPGTVPGPTPGATLLARVRAGSLRDWHGRGDAERPPSRRPGVIRRAAALAALAAPRSAGRRTRRRAAARRVVASPRGRLVNGTRYVTVPLDRYDTARDRQHQRRLRLPDGHAARPLGHVAGDDLRPAGRHQRRRASARARPGRAERPPSGGTQLLRLPAPRRGGGTSSTCPARSRSMPSPQNGDTLYLIQHVGNPYGSRYRVRAYDTRDAAAAAEGDRRALGRDRPRCRGTQSTG